MNSLSIKIDSLVNENSTYGAISFFVVIASLIPLTFKESTWWLSAIEYATTAVSSLNIF